MIKNDNKKADRTPPDRKRLSKIKRKDRLWVRYCKTSDGKIYFEYCKAQNQARCITRKAQKLFEKQIAKQVKSNPKKFWQYVGSKTKHKSSIPDLWMESDDETDVRDKKTTKNDKEKAEVLNKFFCFGVYGGEHCLWQYYTQQDWK